MTQKNSLYSLLIAIFAAVCSYLTIVNYFGATIGRVTMQGKAPEGTTVVVLLSNWFGGTHQERLEFGDEPLNAIKRVGTGFLNAPANTVTLTFQVPDSAVKAGNDAINLYNIQFEKPYSELTVISKRHLSSVFTSDQFFGDNDSFIRVDSDTGLARLSLTAPLTSTFSLWPALPAAFLALLVWLLARNHSWSDLPAFADMSLGREISSAHEFDTINGLRGLAALLVLFSHSAPRFEAVNVGIAILFVISGFLLSKPFVLDANRVFQWRNVESYLTKRVKRILPMYYLFIVISYGLTSQFDTALRNFLFIEATGHLWPMTQIFAFYMFLPLVLMMTSLLWRLNQWLPVIVLAVLAWLWYIYFTDWRPFYNGRFFKEFYLYAFLMGVAGAYLKFGILNQFRLERARPVLGILLLTLIGLTIAWSAPLTPPKWIYPFISEFYAKCLLSLAIIVFALVLQGSWVNRLIANPLFRSVGVVGFSFYLLHGIGIELSLDLQTAVFGVEKPAQRGWLLVVSAFLITYAMSLFTYSYVERPFFGFRRTKR